MNSRLLAALAALVLAICVGAVWFLNSQPPEPVVVAPEAAMPPPTPVRPKEINIVRREPPTAPRPDNSEPLAPLPETAPPPKLADWEMKIDQALSANADESQTAQMLINLLPTLPAEGQAEAARHIINLVLDKDYSRLVPLVKNPGLSEQVLDVFVTDLMNREDEVKLPVLLAIAKIPNHPHHEEAASDLQIFLDEDFGADWGKWEVALKSYLKRQATENAAADAAAPAAR